MLCLVHYFQVENVRLVESHRPPRLARCQNLGVKLSKISRKKTANAYWLNMRNASLHNCRKSSNSNVRKKHELLEHIGHLKLRRLPNVKYFNTNEFEKLMEYICRYWMLMLAKLKLHCRNESQWSLPERFTSLHEFINKLRLPVNTCIFFSNLFNTSHLFRERITNTTVVFLANSNFMQEGNELFPLLIRTALC